MTTNATNLLKIVSQAEWLAARKELLAKEKELTRALDALRAARQALPMVKVDKDYTFESPKGKVSLLELFEGRRQLIVQHFMFDLDWDEGCSSCSYAAADFGDITHLHDKDTSFVMVSRAPLKKLETWKARKGWTLPWVSSYGSDFNYDFYATVDESVAPTMLNYRNKDELGQAGLQFDGKGEIPGYSVFLRDGDSIFHTYATFARGVELLVSGTQFLDLTKLGRQEG